MELHPSTLGRNERSTRRVKGDVFFIYDINRERRSDGDDGNLMQENQRAGIDSSQRKNSRGVGERKKKKNCRIFRDEKRERRVES